MDTCLTGGVDPGISLTRRIFTINPSAVIPEVVEQHHDGCQYSNGVTLFYSTKSYQDKLFMNVPTSGMYSCSMIHILFGYRKPIEDRCKTFASIPFDKLRCYLLSLVFAHVTIIYLLLF